MGRCRCWGGKGEIWLACKPQVALSQLLTARADGSLLSLLKREGLGTAIEVDVEEQTRSFAVVTASLALTTLINIAELA